MVVDEPEEPEFNVSRLWRDTASNSVWEGTTNVLASETVRHLTKGRNLELFDMWIVNAMDQLSDTTFQHALENVWSSLKAKLTFGQDEKHLVHVLGVGRQIVFTLAWLVSSLLLALDAQRDGDDVAREVARRWILEGQGVPGEFAFTDLLYHRSASVRNQRPSNRERVEWDCRIVWGVDLPSDSSAGYRMSRI